MPNTGRVLAFDVNETLLDLPALDASFADVFGDAGLRPMWFQTLLQLSFVGGSPVMTSTSRPRSAPRFRCSRRGPASTSTPAQPIGSSAARPGMVLRPLGDRPELIAKDLAELADLLPEER